MKRMLSLVAALVVALAVVATAGCPDPAEVGHIPKQQLDDTRARVHKAEAKDAQNVNAAAQVTE